MAKKKKHRMVVLRNLVKAEESVLKQLRQDYNVGTDAAALRCLLHDYTRMCQIIQKQTALITDQETELANIDIARKQLTDALDVLILDTPVGYV